MSNHVITANEDASLNEIASLLEKHHIKRVPILKDGKLVGVVSRSNLVQALASQVRGGHGGPDRPYASC